jgi:hypothetical protein
MRKITVFIAAILVMASGCAGLSNWATSDSGKTTLLALGRIASVALSVYVPEAGTIMSAICTAAETKQKDLMVKSLQQAWVKADEAQAKVVVESINEIVGTTKILDEPTTSKQVDDTQKVLKEMCCATGKCESK